MYILYKNTGNETWVKIGWYDSFPEARCAMEEELLKKDGQAFKIEKEGESNP